MEYKHKPRPERLREIIIGQTLVTLLIVAITIYLVFLGLGYKINWTTKSIEHTGILYLSYIPKDANVNISGTDYTKNSPFSVSLLPGDYTAKVSKEGYRDWEHNTKIIADRVISFKNIILFKTDPTAEQITDQDTINSINAPYDILVRNPKGDLDFNDYEIWHGDQLVTRFSTKIHGVIWYPGSEYIAFQQGNQIRVIEKDGSNDTLLITLISDSPTNFIFSWEGSTLLFKDGELYKKAIIN
jgi:hypothetical protein